MENVLGNYHRVTKKHSNKIILILLICLIWVLLRERANGLATDFILEEYDLDYCEDHPRKIEIIQSYWGSLFFTKWYVKAYVYYHPIHYPEPEVNGFEMNMVVDLITGEGFHVGGPH